MRAILFIRSKRKNNGENDGSQVPREELRGYEEQVEARPGPETPRFGRAVDHRLDDDVSGGHRSLHRRATAGSRVPSVSDTRSRRSPTSSKSPTSSNFRRPASIGSRRKVSARHSRRSRPIKDFTGNLILEFGEHSLGEPKYSIEECRERDMTYSAPLRVRVRLITAESGEIKGIPDQEIFMGDFPLMTDKGTFMINGAERVIVSQLVRSPGVYYSQDSDTNSRPTYNATIIPNRGAWIEFETDNGTKNDETEGTIGVRIDKNRKIYVSTFIRALSRPDLGFDWESDEAILALFDDSPLVRNSIEKDKDVKTREDALKEIYKKLRPGEPENAENAEKLLESLFFDEKRYDLAGVGRYKLSGKFHYRIENPDVEDRLKNPTIQINEYMGLDEPPIETRSLTRADMIAVIRRLIKVATHVIAKDDIDHLGNRRVRSVGELLQNQFRVGLLRLERVVRERMTVQDIETVTPQALINIRPVVAAIKEFFGSSQLSQFMDQTNSLAELTHKRRLSALGPGGLSRERAGFEVRDVHHSHYGRICPIETPEGPNIGLIGSLATYGRVNKFGFIETPYRVVKEGVVTDDIHYLTADREDEYIIAQANTPVDEASGKIMTDVVVCRYAEEYIEEPAQRVQLMDVSPKQIVSIATALIPFLEHDDANRALMGANMQRQAVPLLRPDAPIVGTGMEYRAAKDSGSLIVTDVAGTVSAVDAKGMTLTLEDGTEKHFEFLKFIRSNAGTCINQRPIVALGEKVVAGQVLADGPSSDEGGTRPRSERARRVHAVGRLQLRRRNPHLRAHGQGRSLHLDSHRRVRMRSPRHEARTRRDHARHSQRR